MNLRNKETKQNKKKKNEKNPTVCNCLKQLS